MGVAHEIFDQAVALYGVWGLALMGAVVVVWVIQAVWWTGRYARIPRYRNPAVYNPAAASGISVVVILGNDFPWLDNTLPRLLAQNYDEFEVVVVEVGTGEEFSDQMAVLRNAHPLLTGTRIEQDPRFPISNKMAWNVGIKAARYENIILTTSDACPQSERWLECMAKGFRNGDVLIGYCGLQRRPGPAGAVMRANRLMSSVRYLSAAIRNRPFRGIIHNMGFTKTVYFANRGFDHLDMNIGEDDLFVHRIARYNTVSVVMNPHATMRQTTWGGLRWWWRVRKFYSAAYRFYTAAARRGTEWELGSRLCFYVGVAACAAWMPVEVKAGAGVLWLFRALWVNLLMRRIRRRLGEKGLGVMFFIYDILEPFVMPVFALSRRLRPVDGVWR